MFLQQRSLRSSFLNKSTSIENYFALMKDFYLFSPRGRRYIAYLECSSGNYDDVFSRRLLALRSSLPARCISFHSCYTTHTIFSPPLIPLLHISVPLALLSFPTPQAPLVVAASCPTLPATLTQLYVLILLLLRSPAHSLLHVSPHTLLAVLFTTTTFIHFI